MPPEPRDNTGKPVLGRIAPEDFTGRADALKRITNLASPSERARGILLLAAPSSGATELLRQAFDALFHSPENEVAPVYFRWSELDGSVETAARRFLHTFLWQVAAYLQSDPALIYSQPALEDLAESVPAGDDGWAGRLLERYERARASADEEAMVRLCLSAPGEAAARGRRAIVLFDDVHLVGRLRGNVDLGAELREMLPRWESRFVLGGLRRRLLDVLCFAGAQAADVSMLHLENLGEGDARALVEKLSVRYGVALNDGTRDLIVQQFCCNPLFITAVVQAAQRGAQPLTSFLSCQKTYVDDLMGGRINRLFNSMLAHAAPSPAMRRALIRLLHESAAGAEGKSPLESWQKRLSLSPDELQSLILSLHGLELASRAANSVRVSDGLVWRDYLRAQYRAEAAGEPRARVVAESLLDALRRAPQTLESHYRRKSALALRPLIERFNWQRVPASLLQHERFSRAYRGLGVDEIVAGLAAETDLVRLPQIVHTASAASFQPSADFMCEEEQCVVAHGFDGDFYTEASEVVWLAVEIGNHKEAGRGVVEVWHERLTSFARRLKFGRIRVWLIASGGFTPEAVEFLREKEVYASNQHQVELLTSRLDKERERVVSDDAAAPNEFELVIPMGDDSEMIAASAAEMIARRVNFQPEAINQIKTALVEACINAGEHSLSPDRKIYQRFRLESDKLVVTVSSRGVRLPAASANGEQASHGHEGEEVGGGSQGRRGWGLKLIRTLMDEVEFERVDDGTRLRMTKFLRPPE